MGLVDLIKKEDDEYMSVNAFIKLVSNHTKDSNDLVIEYIGKFCLSDRHDNISIYIKNSGNGYSFEGNITYLISKSDKTDSHRFYTMIELEKNDRFLASYFLKDDIFNASFIKSLNLNPDSDNSNLKDENIEDLIDSKFEKQHREYISVNDFVNDLYKGIGPGKPLKFTLKSLLEDTPLREVQLYRLKNLNYSLVSQTDNLKYKNTDELLRHFYSVLDDEQTGTVTSDRKPFKEFYFSYSETQDIINSALKQHETRQMSPIAEQSSTENPKLLKSNNVIESLGENQRLLITYAFFSAEDMTCLIIDENPAYINNDANYLRHHRMVCKAINAGSLVPNDTDQIPAEQVKTWLANHNFIYKGFNDKLSNSDDKMGVAIVGHAKPKTHEQIAEELEVANNRIRQQDIDINRLNDQLNEQENKPIEDKELPYNSQMGVARMLHTILTMHKYDLSATKGKTNSLIESASQSNGTPVTRNFIAQWIDLANQAKSDSTK